MGAHQVIDQIKQAVAERKQAGKRSVSLTALDNYLDRIKQSDLSSSPEERLQEAEHEHQWNVEMVRSGIESGANALKTCLLISGGSAAALLAFASSAWSALRPEGIEALSRTMVCLGTAIFLTGLASAFTYLTQYFFADRLPWHNRAGDCCQWTACFLVIVAYGFVGAAYFQAGDMLTMFKLVKPIPVG
jgi:hypothetical protein